MMNKNYKGNKKEYSEEESLARSHSGWSNTKLTFLALLSAICFGVLFAGLGLYFVFANYLYLLIAVFGGILAVFNFILISKFHR
ncbi:MAG: hypothetical protein MJ072_06085 [Clostridia bacterium]|nr:hypothetical protein [Clostridia bacterium]